MAQRRVLGRVWEDPLLLFVVRGEGRLGGMRVELRVLHHGNGACIITALELWFFNFKKLFSS